jgi:hypothetical protein
MEEPNDNPPVAVVMALSAPSFYIYHRRAALEAINSA